MMVLVLGCDGASAPGTTASLPDEPSPPFRNVETVTAYVGDEACTTCHEEAASAYQAHAMARSFHRWTPDTRIEAPLDEPFFHGPTGFYYSVVEAGGALYQEEYLIGPEGQRLHELRRRVDYVMGSGNVARTYFTEENGRLFQLPLTWYHQRGWDFSPGYELNNARFDRLLPDRCIACHGSYPQPIPFLEGKYAELPPGIGCERCHGPGSLHVSERSTASPPDSTYDDTIVNPEHLSFERRFDVCEQCHVHTPVTVLREGQDAFSYLPSQPLRDHAAFFKATGSIDIVSHADRLRQSACFIATRPTERPLECATCHAQHLPGLDGTTQNQPCLSCHSAAALDERFVSSASRADHVTTANCVGCHMPKVKERTVPHGTFTEHWIRVIAPSATPRAGRGGDRPIDPYFERDRTGPDAEIYQAMGEIVYATLAPDARLLVEGAGALDRALGSDTTRGDAYFLLGVAYRQLGRTEDAIRALERSVRVDPDRPQRLHALARVYQRAGRDPASVAGLYERALELQPALAWIRADYANFLQAQGRREEAEEAYRLALTERPSLAVAAFNLGTLLTGRGRLAEAAEVFQAAVRLNPSLAEALAPLVHVRTKGNVVTGVRILGSPLATLPVRYRGPNAVQLTVNTMGGEPGILFVNVPPRASVRILEPDGTLVRALAAPDGRTWIWDLLTETGNPIAGGLYDVQVGATDAAGQPVVPQRFSVGVVRVRSP
jgi:tetratricopeptide (TPR) repeat protein